MPAEYDPALETFDASESPQPMVEAVQNLANESGRNMDELNGRSFVYITELVKDTYDELPEFWRVWMDWHAPRGNAKMGDL